jgi:hypothetical protein
MGLYILDFCGCVYVLLKSGSMIPSNLALFDMDGLLYISVSLSV